MKNNQKIPVSILADREVFEYLKEKGDERKTRTEAYCDLLDKSLAGFVSPFLRKKAYVLQPNQCHLTVSDLASEWHWHRATVRSFLSAMEAFGLLTRIQLPKSVVITMTVQSGQAAQPRNAQEQPDFARQLREVLSDWVIGKTTAAETGVICGQLVSLAKTEIADRDTGLCLDTHSNTTSAHSGTLVTEHRETALCCIAHAALQKILHKSRFDDSSPLVDFFRFDLGEEWAAFASQTFFFASGKGTGDGGLNRESKTDCITRTIHLHPLTVILPVIGGTRACPSATKQREGGA